MKLSNLIDERNERTRKRKQIKRKMDKIIGLSYKDDDKRVMKMSTKMELADNTIRLLDEGYFDSGFVIKKGTLEKFLNGENEYVRGYEMTEDGWKQTDVLNLTDDFVGTVNLGHMDFPTFPFILGEWDKNDLKLVDIENDRKGLDVSVRLDEDSVFVKELKRQPFDIGISSEFFYHINEEDTEELAEVYGIEMPVIDEVYIFAYGLVGECGNVNSSGLELKGADMPKEIKELMAETEVDVEVELENAEEVAEEIEKIDEAIEELGIEEIDIIIDAEKAKAEEEEEAKKEVADAEPAEEGEADADAEEEVVELSADDVDEETEDEDAEEESSDEEDEVEEDEDEEDLDDEDEIEEVDELTEALSVIHELRAQVAELSNINAELKKNNRRLSKKLAKENEKKMKFLEETKNLSVELYENELEAKQAKEEELAAVEEQKDYVLTGGIADI